jgi:hypothetical protein
MDATAVPLRAVPVPVPTGASRWFLLPEFSPTHGTVVLAEEGGPLAVARFADGAYVSGRIDAREAPTSAVLPDGGIVRVRRDGTPEIVPPTAPTARPAGAAGR